MALEEGEAMKKTSKQRRAATIEELMETIPPVSLQQHMLDGMSFLRGAVGGVLYQTELRITLRWIELWTHAVDPKIHRPARALLKAVKAAGFGK